MTQANPTANKPLGEGELLGAARSQVSDQSSQASTSIRALALAIIAVCWLFLAGKDADASAVIAAATSHRLLAFGLVAGVVSLVFDAAQYCFTTLYWRRYYAVVEMICDRTSFRSKDSARLWNRADDYKLVASLLDQTGTNTDSLRTSRAQSIERIKEILADHYDGTTATSTVDQQQRLRDFFNQPYGPRLGVRTTRYLFWAKTLTVIAGGIAIVAYVVLTAWPSQLPPTTKPTKPTASPATTAPPGAPAPRTSTAATTATAVSRYALPACYGQTDLPTERVPPQSHSKPVLLAESASWQRHGFRGALLVLKESAT
ncbi:hypothetical protein [Mycobacterium colombiense]|uniref:hypothetical protein n=1 Tax=Mycobacterium colombiense TaxID=339268 RepID=UPI000B06515D|nr:hypothetical protein [Mycobacterium colombiense]